MSLPAMPNGPPDAPYSPLDERADALAAWCRCATDALPSPAGAMLVPRVSDGLDICRLPRPRTDSRTPPGSAWCSGGWPAAGRTNDPAAS
jgi:hypothetical protein